MTTIAERTPLVYYMVSGDNCKEYDLAHEWVVGRFAREADAMACLDAIHVQMEAERADLEIDDLIDEEGYDHWGLCGRWPTYTCERVEWRPRRPPKLLRSFTPPNGEPREHDLRRALAAMLPEAARPGGSG